MSLSSLIFFAPNWPQILMNRFSKNKIDLSVSKVPLKNNANDFGIREYILFAYFLLQVTIPLRHILYPGQVIWTEETIKFSWQVMVADKVGSAVFTIQNRQINPKDILTDYQYRMMTIQPEHILQFARYLQKQEYERTGIAGIPVYVLSHVSINGKPARPLFSPNEDLTKIKTNFFPLKGLIR